MLQLCLAVALAPLSCLFGFRPSDFGFPSCSAVALAALSCVSVPKPAPRLERYEYERPEMGVPFRIVLYAPDRARADEAAEAAFQRVKELNDMMSDYDAESELSKLSRTSGQGREVSVSPDLWLVLEQAQAMSERSDGAFDITVGPCVNLWRRARRQHQLPDPERLALARRAVGYRLVRLNPKRHAVELLAPDMRLDLGGIAKGYAVEQALRTLRRAGPEPGAGRRRRRCKRGRPAARQAGLAHRARTPGCHECPARPVSLA